MAEGARLESVYTLIAYRGFESLPLRQTQKGPLVGPFFVCGTKWPFEPEEIKMVVRRSGRRPRRTSPRSGGGPKGEGVARVIPPSPPNKRAPFLGVLLFVGSVGFEPEEIKIAVRLSRACSLLRHGGGSGRETRRSGLGREQAGDFCAGGEPKKQLRHFCLCSPSPQVRSGKSATWRSARDRTGLPNTTVRQVIPSDAARLAQRVSGASANQQARNSCVHLLSRSG